MPGRMMFGSVPISARFSAYHRGHSSAIWSSDARGPSRWAAMSHKESPTATVIDAPAPVPAPVRRLGVADRAGGGRVPADCADPAGGWRVPTDCLGVADPAGGWRVPTDCPGVADPAGGGPVRADCPGASSVGQGIGGSSCWLGWSDDRTMTGTARVGIGMLDALATTADTGVRTMDVPTAPVTNRRSTPGVTRVLTEAASRPMPPGSSAATAAISASASHAATHHSMGPARLAAAASVPLLAIQGRRCPTASANDLQSGRAIVKADTSASVTGIQTHSRWTRFICVTLRLNVFAFIRVEQRVVKVSGSVVKVCVGPMDHSSGGAATAVPVRKCGEGVGGADGSRLKTGKDRTDRW